MEFIINTISKNYPKSNLIVIKHFLKIYNNLEILEYIKYLSEIELEIPKWENNILKINRLYLAHNIAKSFLCLYKNKYDFIFIFDKLQPPKIDLNLDYDGYCKQLMTNNQLDPDDMFTLSIEKLKFIFNYFEFMKSNSVNNLDIITIYKLSGKTNIELKQLSDIEFIKGYINYEDEIKVDFANKNIGGGVLKYGCCQEEILFLNNTEMIGIMSFIDELESMDALMIDGIIQYSKSKHYGFDLEYNYSYLPTQNKDLQKIIIVDAIDYRNTQLNQYAKQNKENELYKIINGYKLIGSNNIISTGHWGCGAFKGNPNLKFMIQWLACSLTKNKLKYYYGNQLYNIIQLYNKFKNKTTMDLYNVIMEYNGTMDL